MSLFVSVTAALMSTSGAFANASPAVELLQHRDELRQTASPAGIPSPSFGADSLRFLHSLVPLFSDELANHRQLVSLLDWDAFQSSPTLNALATLASVARTQAADARLVLDSITAPARALPTGERALGALSALRDADAALRIAARRAADDLVGMAKTPAAIVVSGGVSLGTYEAGLLHYYTQFQLAQRRSVAPDSPDLARMPGTITGASAGAVNAFLAALAGCREPVEDPTESLFYRLWIPVDIAQLMDEKAVTATSLLSRKGIDDAVELLSTLWNDDKWSTAPCRANVGLNATRVNPRLVPLNRLADQSAGTRMSLPLQTEHLLLTIEGGGGRSPAVRSWVPSPQQADPEFYVDFLIDVGAGGSFPASVSDVLRASAAFPVAWPFVYLRAPAENERQPFLDGGVFDNNPLRVARNIIRWTPGSSLSPASQRFFYVDPDATAWEPPSSTNANAPESFIDTHVRLLQNLAQTARKADLLSTIEEDPTIRDRIEIPVRAAPVMGSYLLNFFAFFDEDFRRYDFYAGMSDAMDALNAPDGQATRLRAAGFDASVRVTSRAFDCLRAFRSMRTAKPAGDLPVCKDVFGSNPVDAVHNRNFIALLNSSRAVRKNFIDPALASGSYDRTAEFAFLLKTLKSEGFTFSDPELRNASPAEVIRNKIHPLLEVLARKQPGIMGPAAVSVGLKTAADSLMYRPSAWWLALGLSTKSGVQLEYSHRLSSALRVALGLRAYRIVIERFASVGRTGLSYALHPYVLPLSVELQPGSFWWLQVGGGVGLGTHYGFVNGATFAARRTSVELEAHVALLQRVSLAFSASRFLDSCPDDCPQVFRSYSPDTDRLAPGPWDLAVTLSWRWMD